ncbi:MAG: toprim domain-containing protein, partial [Planctomycetota bacterium]
YKNSSETTIYAKSKTLYGLNWAKGDIVTADQVIVCEGYTDVIGFHRAGVRRAVATCGTALTEDHVRLLKRYASQVVLAFDADAAGQGAAQRFYEWEDKYKVRVSVAKFPAGKDPGDLSVSDPDALKEAVDHAVPFLGFRLNQVLNSRQLRSPEDRARMAQEAMAIVAEHPDQNVQKLYAGQVAAHVGLQVNDLSAALRTHGRAPVRVAPTRQIGSAENAEFVAVAMLMQRWDDIAPWLVEDLFAQDVARRAFLAVAESGGAIERALELADPEARELLERAAVTDVDADPVMEARNLISATTRRLLARQVGVTEPDELHAMRDARLALERIDDPEHADDAAEALLGWIHGANEEHG